MKRRVPRGAVVALGAAAIFLLGTLGQGQAPAEAGDAASRQLAAEVLAQHRAVVENQAQIEKKMETLAESLRLARIYASRGGKGGAK